MIKLYSGPSSLNCRKVEIALPEKGLAFERELDAFSQTQGYRPKHEPPRVCRSKGQVPVLIDGDVAIYDSTVILKFSRTPSLLRRFTTALRRPRRRSAPPPP